MREVIAFRGKKEDYANAIMNGMEDMGKQASIDVQNGAAMATPRADELRHDWRRDEVEALYGLPFNDLLFNAQQVHRRYFDANEVQLSTLLSIKTGGCVEDCGYCNQSTHHATNLKASKLMASQEVVAQARTARDAGASRYCMGAAWRGPKDRDMGALCDMVREVKALGLETCMTLGMLSDDQAAQLHEAGLDYYNHNIDTSEEYYTQVTATRTFQDRLDTLERVREAGMKVCSGGIVGMGEEESDRAGMLRTLANLSVHPESVPINALVAIKNTPLGATEPINPIDFVRTIAVARILMPSSMVRLSAGREKMSIEMQALCFMAGANSIFVGDELLTTPNPDQADDAQMFKRLGLRPMAI